MVVGAKWAVSIFHKLMNWDFAQQTVEFTTYNSPTPPMRKAGFKVTNRNGAWASETSHAVETGARSRLSRRVGCGTDSENRTLRKNRPCRGLSLARFVYNLFFYLFFIGMWLFYRPFCTFRCTCLFSEVINIGYSKGFGLNESDNPLK